MIVSNPQFLWMLPLTGLPVLFHLFLKIRKRPYTFSTLMFFHMIDPKLSARRQIREWLVLLLRMLFILFLLLALARLIWLGTRTRGSVSLVTVIDNSSSMNAPGANGKTKLETAIESASALISGLNADDSAGVVLLVDDPLVSLPEGLTSDKAALKSALDKIAETEATGKAAGAMTRAFAMLEASRASCFEIHVFTDLQENEWNKTSTDKISPRTGARIVIHRIPSAPETAANVSITGMELPRQRLVAGRRFSIQIQLVNRTSYDADIRLHSRDDQNNRQTQSLFIPKSSEKTVDILLSSEIPGIHWLTAWIEEDSFPFDNQAAMIYSCSGRKHIVFCGNQEEFGQLPVAFAPAGDSSLSGLLPVFTQAETLSETLRDKNPVLIVLTWPKLAQLRRQTTDDRQRTTDNGHLSAIATGATAELTTNLLQSFVEQGGNLFIVPSVTEHTAISNIPDWAGAEPEPFETMPKGTSILAFDKHAPVFNDLRNEKGDVVFRNIKAFKLNPLRLSRKSRPLLGLADGRVLLAELEPETGKPGHGSIFASGLAFDSSWSNLPLKGSFLALVQSIALSGAKASKDSSVSLVAGDRLQLPPNALEISPDSGTMVHIQSIAGSGLDWKCVLQTLPVLARSGVYAIRSDKESILIAVRASDSESRHQFLSEETVSVLGSLDYSVKPIAGINNLVKEMAFLRKGIDLYQPFLVLAFLTFMTEGWIANKSMKRRIRDK